MENVTITLSGAGIQESQELNIQVSITAIVNIGAGAARRQATAWLAGEVGNMLIGGVPQLIIGHRTVWRVPAILTSSEKGHIGPVGAVDVDAESGRLLITPELKTEILTNAEDIIRSAPAPAG